MKLLDKINSTAKEIALSETTRLKNLLNIELNRPIKLYRLRFSDIVTAKITVDFRTNYAIKHSVYELLEADLKTEYEDIVSCEVNDCQSEYGSYVILTIKLRTGK